jgi:transcriptional regulator with XRE-family HTH domain
MSRGLQTLSVNLRRLRTERGISMGDLSRASKVGKATLSKLESGEGNPTVETLWSLADALGVALSELLADTVADLHVLRPDDTVWLSSREMAGRLVDRIVNRGVVEVWEARFLRGQPFRTDHVPGHVQGTREHWFIRSGHLRMGPQDGESVDLGPGDYVRFVIDRPFVFQALDGDVDLMMLVNYPSTDAGR